MLNLCSKSINPNVQDSLGGPSGQNARKIGDF